MQNDKNWEWTAGRILSAAVHMGLTDGYRQTVLMFILL